MFEKLDFTPGKIAYDDFNADPETPLTDQTDLLKEDMFQVMYDDQYIIDVGWYPSFSQDGSFQIVIIKDFNWSEPVCKRECRDMAELDGYMKACAEMVKRGLFDEQHYRAAA